MNKPSHLLSRRAMLGQTGLVLLGASSGIAPAAAATASPAKPVRTAPALEPLNRFPRMVHEYFVRRVREIAANAEKRRAALNTRADAEAYVREVREKIARCFGPWPEKTPLNPRITGVVERDSYRIEKVIFDSRPNFPVTANLYIPKDRGHPLPGVVGSCGHSQNGKAAAPYQSFAQGLARQGYVVLLFDPISQGERLQYLNESLGSRLGDGRYVCVDEHLLAGNQQFLVGEFFGAWRAWDGIRALDYLLTRPEVDPRHVGVTGNSGGGTLTTWLAALDPRWTMAAPSCFVTTFRRNLENELPADTEQCPPGALALGLDMSDFIAAMAPKPVILLGQEKDSFDVRGLEEAFGRLQRLYRLLGAEENIQLFIGPDYHGYSQPNREAMYRWFNRQTGISAAQTEPALTLEEDATLWCTPRGQVGDQGARSMVSFTRERALELRRARPSLSGEALASAVRERLNLPPRSGVPEYRIQRPVVSRRYPKPHTLSYAVETEPDVFALVYRLHDEAMYSRPPRSGKRALLYVAHHSSDAELRDEVWLRELLRAESGAALFACDVRGIGESRPNTTGQGFLAAYGNDFFYAIHGVMLDYPYVGQKTHDVLRVLDWLAAHGHDDVHLIAQGWGAIPATFAALLSDSVKQITLRHAPRSFSEIAEAEIYAWPLSTFVPRVLESFDLPDCYRELERKRLRQIEPWNAAARPA